MKITGVTPGDVIAVPGGGVGGWLVSVGQAIARKPSLGSHVVGITHQDVKGRWIGIQGQPGGVGLVDCTPVLADARARSNTLQPRANDKGQITAFRAACAKALGLKYDWAGVIADTDEAIAQLAHIPDLSADIDKLWRWPDPKTGLMPGHVVCSSLFAMIYDLPQVGWAHPGLGKERMCEPADWWNWNDGELWLK